MKYKRDENQEKSPLMELVQDCCSASCISLLCSAETTQEILHEVVKQFGINSS
jgi:hypothetical protein